MRCNSYKFKASDIYLYPIGDIHIGDKSFNKTSLGKLKGYINWIKKTPNAYAFLMGDIVNCATLNSPSSPFAQDMDLSDQIKLAVKLFEPIKHKILGAIDGNHENRLRVYSGYSPTISICERLGIQYFGESAVLLLRLGCHSGKNKDKSPRATFVVYAHHTVGGGSTPGGKMNRVDKLRQIVCNADIYLGSHNHALGCFHTIVYRVNPTTEKIEELRQMLVDCGGYLSYRGSYAETRQLPPLKIGSPRIHFIIKRNKNEVKKDIHVSL